MFNFENETKKTETSHEAERMLAKMLSEMLLESNAPESTKMSIRLIDSAQSLQDALHEVLSRETLTSEKIDINNAKKFCLFLTALTGQIKAFAVNNPLISNTEADNENI